MLPTVTLLTDRNEFVPQWQHALGERGLQTRVCATTELADAVNTRGAVIVDLASQKNDADELLAIVGFVRAHGALPVVHTDASKNSGNSGDDDSIDDVVEELCAGLVARNASDVERVAECLPRRLDETRRTRFEFVTLSPVGTSVLAVLGNGHAAILPRPLSSADDASEIVSIELSANASSASIKLQSGVEHTVSAIDIQAQRKQANSVTEIEIQGGRLGARLRELRLAAGLTQAELARRTGIHRPNIARVEAGRHTPSLETLSRMATAIGVPATQVLATDG